MATVAQLTSPGCKDDEGGIACHAWNADGTQLAISPNNHELHIYEGTDDPDPRRWVRRHVLAEHEMVIGAVAWSHATNKIVTVGHDRNAFVWTYQEEEPSPDATGPPPPSSSGRTDDAPPRSQGSWKPSLTLLGIDRGALDVRWSPDGRRFAVASAAKCVAVCHYEEAHDWWVSKIIRKHKSSVLSVAWHPSGRLLATGGCDSRCRVFAAGIDDADDEAEATEQQQEAAGPFPRAQAFGEAYVEFACGGWVHGVAWSPTGRSLAFCGHDARVHVVTFPQPADGTPPVEAIVVLPGLPATALAFVSERAILAGGHDCNPMLLTGTGENWALAQYLDSAVDQQEQQEETTSSKGHVQAARAVFEGKAAGAGAGAGSGGGEAVGGGRRRCEPPRTRHQQPILSLRPYPPSRKGGGENEMYMTYSTAAMDGRVVLWRLPELNIALASLGLD